VSVSDQEAGTVDVPRNDAPGNDDPLNDDDLVNVEPPDPIQAPESQAPESQAPNSGASGRAAGCVATVGNRYRVRPMVLTDREIQLFLEPLMQAALPELNASAPDGLRYNIYLQKVGVHQSTSLASAGSPSYDHYEKWLERKPEWRERLNAHATQTCIQRQGLSGGDGNDPSSTSIGNEF